MTVKRMASTVLCLIACVILLPHGSANAREENPVEQAQYSIVRVICNIGDRSAGYYYSIGTGFAVGKAGDSAQIFVTNNHVVEANPLAVYVTITNTKNVMEATVLYQDAVHDIAVLKTKASIVERHPIELMSPSELNKSQDIYCLGFPGLMDEYSDNEDCSSTISDITITKGSVSNPTYKVGGVLTILSDVKVNHGNSGGPMVDEYGRAVGINTAILPDENGQNMSIAVSIDYVMDILDSLGIRYETGNAKATEPPATKRPATTEQDKQPEESVPDTTEDHQDRNFGGITTYIIASAVLAAIVVCMLVIITKRRRATPHTGPAYPMNPTPPIGPAYPMNPTPPIEPAYSHNPTPPVRPKPSPEPIQIDPSYNVPLIENDEYINNTTVSEQHLHTEANHQSRLKISGKGNMDTADTGKAVKPSTGIKKKDVMASDSSIFHTPD